MSAEAGFGARIDEQTKRSESTRDTLLKQIVEVDAELRQGEIESDVHVQDDANRWLRLKTLEHHSSAKALQRLANQSMERQFVSDHGNYSLSEGVRENPATVRPLTQGGVVSRYWQLLTYQQRFLVYLCGCVLVLVISPVRGLAAAIYHCLVFLIALPALVLAKRIGLVDSFGIIHLFLWFHGIVVDVRYGPLGEQIKAPCFAADMRVTPIVVSNHVTVVDGAVLAMVFRSLQFVAARRVWKLLTEVSVAEAVIQDRPIFFEKFNLESRRTASDQIVARVEQWKPHGKPLILFPEGFCANGKNISKFRLGAFKPGAPVRPVILVPPDLPARCGLPSWLARAAQILCCFHHLVHVRVFPPYIPSIAERCDPELYAQNCFAFMEAKLAEVRLQIQSPNNGNM